MGTRLLESNKLKVTFHATQQHLRNVIRMICLCEQRTRRVHLFPGQPEWAAILTNRVCRFLLPSRRVCCDRFAGNLCPLQHPLLSSHQPVSEHSSYFSFFHPENTLYRLVIFIITTWPAHLLFKLWSAVKCNIRLQNVFFIYCPLGHRYWV